MKNFSVIVACDASRGIGKGNDLPWRLSMDMKHFKEITTAEYVPGKINIVLMGRKTWDSLPAKYRPLPNRLNVVLTSNNQVVFPEGVKVFRSFDEALYCLSKDDRLGKLFVIGGANVFSQAIIHPACSELYLTQIDQSFPCDVFFPPIPSNLKKDQSSDFFEETGVKFQFIHFTAM